MELELHHSRKAEKKRGTRMTLIKADQRGFLFDVSAKIRSIRVIRVRLCTMRYRLAMPQHRMRSVWLLQKLALVPG